MSERVYGRLLAVGGLALACVLAVRAPGVGDYPTDAGPALTAIAHGNLSGFFSHQPAMGSVSLFVRAPFVALGAALGDGPVGLYRWGTLPCLLAVAVIAIWLGRISVRRGSRRAAPILIVAVALLGPLVNDALYWGTPKSSSLPASASGHCWPLASGERCWPACSPASPWRASNGRCSSSRPRCWCSSATGSGVCSRADRSR